MSNESKSTTIDLFLLVFFVNEFQHHLPKGVQWILRGLNQATCIKKITLSEAILTCINALMNKFHINLKKAQVNEVR